MCVGIDPELARACDLTEHASDMVVGDGGMLLLLHTGMLVLLTPDGGILVLLHTRMAEEAGYNEVHGHGWVEDGWEPGVLSTFAPLSGTLLSCNVVCVVVGC